MLIIIEGVDGVGKTSIATELAQRLQLPYVDAFQGHESLLQLEGAARSPIAGIGDYGEDVAMLDFARRTGASAVVDRCLASASVYRALRGEMVLSPRLIGEIWSQIAPVDTYYIWVQRDLQQCRRERWALWELMRISDLFGDEYAKFPGTKCIYDNNATVHFAVEAIAGWLKRQEMRE